MTDRLRGVVGQPDAERVALIRAWRDAMEPTHGRPDESRLWNHTDILLKALDQCEAIVRDLAAASVAGSSPEAWDAAQRARAWVAAHPVSGTDQP